MKKLIHIAQLEHALIILKVCNEATLFFFTLNMIKNYKIKY